jgi:hypothetical protein
MSSAQGQAVRHQNGPVNAEQDHEQDSLAPAASFDDSAGDALDAGFRRVPSAEKAEQREVSRNHVG